MGRRGNPYSFLSVYTPSKIQLKTCISQQDMVKYCLHYY